MVFAAHGSFIQAERNSMKTPKFLKPASIFQTFLCICTFTAVSAFTNPFIAHTQAQSLNRFLHWSYQDAGAFARDVGPKVPIIVFAGTAGLVSSIRVDEPFQDDVKETYVNDQGLWTRFLNTSNELGGPKVALPLAGVFTASLLTRNTKFQDAAFTSLQSWLYTGGITYSLKYAFGRYRPEDGFGSTKFRPFSGNTSFPSGHTSAAFAIVTPWVFYYPHPITYGLFAISAGTAVARMARDKHWPTDVFAGAALGFFTGRYLARRHLQQSTGNKIRLTPMSSPRGIVLLVEW